LKTTQEPLLIALVSPSSANLKPSALPIAKLLQFLPILLAYLLILELGSKPGALAKKIGFLLDASYFTKISILSASC